MSDTIPETGQPPVISEGAGERGRIAALTTWVLYALTLPTGGLSTLIGAIIAYAARGQATGLIRTHIDAQISLFWSGFIWAILLTVAWIVCLLLTTLFVGIPLLFVVWAALLLLAIWLTIRSIVGVIALSDRRAP